MRRFAASVVLVALTLPAAALAQGPRAGGRERGSARPDGRFDEVAPKLGEKLPNITLFDAKGKKVRIAKLRGKPTVLVTGCLT